MTNLLTIARRFSRANIPWSFPKASENIVARQQYGVRKLCSTLDIVPDIHTAILKMPSIMDAHEGKVLEWFKKEGESVQEGDSLCQVEVGDLLLEISAPFAGILADIRVNLHQPVRSDAEVAVVCDSQDSYLNYIEASRIRVHDEELIKELEEAKAEKKVEIKPSAGLLLREVKHLLQQGKLDAKNDAAFVSQLQALARKGHPELFTVFDASFEGTQHDPDTFDAKFFIENARALVDERRE